MGFRDAEWAYGLDGLAMREKVVLTALCHRTDDKTHATYVGQQTIADMIGSSADFVRRGLKELEHAGVIQRTRRTGQSGYRTSDVTTVNRSYQADSQLGQTPTRPRAYKADSPDLTGSKPSPTQTTAGAEEITQLGHSEDHSDSHADAFERAWKTWPKKVEKRASNAAFVRAARQHGVDQLERDITRFGLAYARSVSEPRFVPSLSAWLRGERWTDDLPVPSLHDPTRGMGEPRARHQFNASPQLTRTEQNMAVVARIAAKEAASCEHRWMGDGTCNHCTARRLEVEA